MTGLERGARRRDRLLLAVAGPHRDYAIELDFLVFIGPSLHQQPDQ